MRNKQEIEKAIKEPNFNWLGRESFIKEFSEYLISQNKSAHVCINGVWGSGKTTTILGIIDYLNKIDKGNENPLVLYIDTWKYEHYEHPLFMLLKVMEENAKEIIKSIESDMKKMSIQPQIGINVPFFSFSISPKKSSTQNRVLNYAEYVDELNKMMLKAVRKFKEENNNQLIIFIDELDRVKPDFALKILEMFHHLQDELPTHIVYSVDMNQLNSIVKHYYGYEYNVEIFVHKVFDSVILLKKLTKQEMIGYIGKNLTSNLVRFDINSIIEIIFKYLNSDQSESLRTINKICQKIAINLNKGYFKSDQYTSLRSSFYLGNGRDDNLWGYVELLIFLEILSLNDPLLVRRILSGKSIDVLYDLLLEANELESSSRLLDLVYNSFRHNNLNTKSKQEMNRDDVISGLRKLFFSPTREYTYNSVFSQVEL